MRFRRGVVEGVLAQVCSYWEQVGYSSVVFMESGFLGVRLGSLRLGFVSGVVFWGRSCLRGQRFLDVEFVFVWLRVVFFIRFRGVVAIIRRDFNCLRRCFKIFFIFYYKDGKGRVIWFFNLEGFYFLGLQEVVILLLEIFFVLDIY